MCNARPKSSPQAANRLRIPFASDPGWYEAYWYAPEAAPVRAPVRSLIDFMVAVVRSAMALPAEIRRVTRPCKITGERQ